MEELHMWEEPRQAEEHKKEEHMEAHMQMEE